MSINTNQPGTSLFEQQAIQFEKAMEPQNFVPEQELTETPADPKLFTGIWSKEIHVPKQQFMVYIYLAPADLVDPTTQEYEAVVRQKADWIYFMSLGCFKNKEKANEHALMLSKKYPYFDFHVTQMYAFIDIPSRIEPGSMSAENPTGKIVNNNARVQGFMEDYFKSQEKSKNAHLSRIGRDMQKATEEQEKMRIINKREQERLARGGNPDELTLDSIQRQLREFDENGGVEAYEDESHFSNKFETPAEAMKHRGYKFGTDFVNVTKPNDNSPLVAAAQANALAAAATANQACSSGSTPTMSRQQPQTLSGARADVVANTQTQQTVQSVPSVPIVPNTPAPNIEEGTSKSESEGGSLISRIDITDTLPPHQNPTKQPLYQYEFQIKRGEDMSMEEFEQTHGGDAYAQLGGQLAPKNIILDQQQRLE